MGLQLVSKDSIAPWNSSVYPPVMRGLEGWFTFDTDVSRFSLNRASGKADATLVGTPTAFATHGRFQSLSNYLQTQISDSENQTIIVVGKAVNAIPAGASPNGDATTPFYAGNVQGASSTPGYANSFGSGLFHAATSSLTGSACRDNGSGGVTSGGVLVSSEVPTDWGIRALRTSASAPTATFNLTRGVSALGSSTAKRVLAVTKHRIGSATANFSAQVDISAVAFYSVALSDSEIAAVAGAMRVRMQRLGISV